MRRKPFRALMLAAAMTVCRPAAAWLIYPDRDAPARTVVEIERPYGDLVAFATLPHPFDRIVRPAGGPKPLLFRWRYSREAVGSAVLEVGAEGRGKIEFEFLARELIDGQRLGAAAVLVARNGTPLHTFYARADTMGGVFDDGTRVFRVSLTVERPPGWWADIGAIDFFYMTYHPMQKLDDAGVWAAMRRAVGNFTKGQGTEQRG